MYFIGFLMIVIALLGIEIGLISMESLGGVLGEFFDFFRLLIPNNAAANEMTKYLYWVALVICLIFIMWSRIFMHKKMFRRLYFISLFYHFVTFSLFIRFGIDERASTVLTRNGRIADLVTLVTSFVLTLMIYNVKKYFDNKFKKKFEKMKLLKLRRRNAKIRRTKEYRSTQHFLQMYPSEQEYHFNKMSLTEIQNMFPYMTTGEIEYWSNQYEKCHPDSSFSNERG